MPIHHCDFVDNDYLEPLPQPNEEPENDPSNHSSDSAFAENVS